MAKPGPSALLKSSNPYATGLVGAWLFNENEGMENDPITDYSGNGHHGVIEHSGVPDVTTYWTTTEPEHDPSFILDEASVEMWCRVPDHADFDFAGDYTVVVGYKAAVSGLAVNDVLIGKASTDSWNDGFTIYTSASSKVKFGFVGSTFANAAVDPTTTPSYSDTDYHQVALVFDSVNADLFGYVDGTLVASETTQAAHATNSSDIYIGRQANAATRPWEGYIYYAYIWNRALSSTEIEDLFDSPYQMWGASAIHPELLTLLRQQPNDAFAVFELDRGSTGTYTGYAETWAASKKTDNPIIYHGNVIEAGEIRRGISDSGFSLPRDQATFTIRDNGTRDFERQLMLVGLLRIVGSPARIRIASRTLESSKWFTVFSGVVEDFSSPVPYEWSFVLRRDDRALEGLIHVPTIQEYDWVDVPDESIGVPANLVYGKHYSAGTAVTGMVPTTYVDNVEFQYLISYGRITTLAAVYVDGVLASTSDYTLEYVETHGRWWSVVDFTSDQGDAVVTVDCEGFGYDGIGAGDPLIENPADQLKHFLTNFVFGEWTSDDWLSAEDYNIDTGYFSETAIFLEDKQIARGSRVIPGDSTGVDVLNEWCENWQIPSFWTFEGKIAVRVDDHTVTDIFIDAPWFRQEYSPEPEFRSIGYVSREIVNEIRTDYLYAESDGAFQKHLTVIDPTVSAIAPHSLKLYWRESDYVQDEA